jgi:hypothetical protein
MYEPTTSLSLHRLSRHSLQDRYESDEETVSEADAGAHDLLSSPVGSQRGGIFDSDLSADEKSDINPESDRDERLLSPPVVKRLRPVSTDTIKRNSDAAFDEETYVFDLEEQMVLELPAPDSPQLASSIFLQPSIYAAPKPPRPVNSRSRSPSPSSIFSVEEADIQVAQKVSFMEPRTRPTVVLINALGSRSKSSKLRSSHSRSRESSRSRPGTLRPDSRLASACSESVTKSTRVSLQEVTALKPSTSSSSRLNDDMNLAPSATINRVSDIPPVPYLPARPRTTPTADYRTRPRTSGSERIMPPPLNLRPRRPTDTRRPPSMRSASSNTIPIYSSRPTTPFSPEDSSLGTIHDDLPGLTRTCSPVSIASTSSPPPYISTKRSASSIYSVSNILAHRSPLMMRRMTRKHSSSSIHSLSSLRSEMDPHGPASSQISVATQPGPAPSADCHVVRKSSQRRHSRHHSVLPTGRGFLGLKLGKKSHTKA